MEVAHADIPRLLEGAAVDGARGALWSRESEDLDVNVVTFPEGEGVAAHVNREVDVLLVVVSGRGVVEIDGAALYVAAGNAVVIPKGARRAVRSASAAFAYVTCHRRRRPLRPTTAGR